ncbi:hypothetical protein R3P38DRAFT_3173188 [Favolaschia claudopus]|uniref:Uncharacterized protein n=1 Tax=Favolaschia claudopus TaxID=2862362 RepID=A0AAW0B916_9AGAR
MARPKSKLTKEQILERRAQAAWEYRQRLTNVERERHRAAVNEKARARMRARREKLRRAPADVQLEHAVKAAQYRRNYVERTRRAVTAAALKSFAKSKSLHPLPSNRAPPCAPRRRPRSPDEDASWEEWEEDDATQRPGCRDDSEERDIHTRAEYYRPGNFSFIR